MTQLTADPASRGGTTAGAQALDAQADLATPALFAFGSGLPVFIWLGAQAPNAGWMSVAFVLFAIGWGGFYVLTRELHSDALQLRRRVAVQLAAGLLWAAAIATVCAFSYGAGPYQTPLMLACAVAALVCVVFAAPWLPSLLIVAPAAMAAPLIGLAAGGGRAAAMAWAAVATAVGVVTNRVLHRQFVQAAARERMLDETLRRLSVTRPGPGWAMTGVVGAEAPANDRSVA
ncbi:hypothetical protein [Phenylobacterium sp. J367]|uniref:hypothetical protein n=1 Tax=Phenylobacterium sp. J367 TaxID=2898435 RepID=UPI002151B921|nr:hypothetical protein [Phenylobacterium sp. J367]MCR5880838.1 hypothetical protein [Phenylobacterium sp. J367]